MSPQAIDSPFVAARTVGTTKAAEPISPNAPAFHTTLGNGTFGIKAG